MPKIAHWTVASAAALFALLALLALLALPARAADDFLPPEQAFRYTTESDGQSVRVLWDVAPGYYLYRKRMGVASPLSSTQVGEPVYPKGETHTDEYFGEQEVFRGKFTVTAPITFHSGRPASLPLELKLQGCADAGLCYPPTTLKTTVALPTAAAASAPASASADGATPNGIAALMQQTRAQNDEFLPPDEAFQLTVVADGPDRLRLTWQIAPEYYLYKGRLKVTTEGAAAQLGQLELPAGESHEDEYFGVQEIYHDELVARLPVARAGGTALALPLTVTYQGCAEAGLCYPPISKTFTVDLPAGGTMGAGTGAFVSEQDRLARLIAEGDLLLVLATFFGIGLLLSLTPCVLPMVPILSGIILANQGPTPSTYRAFLLSLSYVLGMAFTYTLAGIAAAAAGQQVQALFQQTWIVVLFALLFVMLALSMFGAFTFQMPAAIQTRLSNASNQQRAGTFGGVAVMGALSALIVTTCVAPALVGTLAFISQSGDMVRGGAALFAMSLGMGVPLLIVGASAGKLLPRAGAWMDTIKQFVGVMMLAVAVWMVARLVPGRVALVLWAIPALVLAWLLFKNALKPGFGQWVARAIAAIAAAYGLALLAGAALGGTDPLAPIPQLAEQHEELPFKTIKTVADLEAEVKSAAAQGRAVMLDFYADWCVSCKEMEKYTFTDEAVRAALKDVTLLRADVTANDAEDQALLKHFGIFGPPTIAFYSPDGTERRNYRVVGYMKAAEFASISAQATAR